MTEVISHASQQRTGLPTTDPTTGEVRIPIDLFAVDELQTSVPLVLSRSEAEQLRDRLTPARLEVARP